MNTSDILVTIHCITYNQEKYIGQAIESFLKQKTSFLYEVVVYDDASSDETPEIVLKYARQNPDIIKPILSKENQYSKGGFKKVFDVIEPMISGKYIAFCDGDDYWIDSYKLQKQVDILESQPNAMMVYTNYETVDECGIPFYRKEYEKKYKSKSHSGDILPELIKDNFPLHSTTMYRREVIISDFVKECPVLLDYLLSVSAAFKGDVYYLPEKTVSYRCSPGSFMQTKQDFVLKAYEVIQPYIYKAYALGISKKEPKHIDSNIKKHIVDYAWYLKSCGINSNFIEELIEIDFGMLKYLVPLFVNDYKNRIIFKIKRIWKN